HRRGAGDLDRFLEPAELHGQRYLDPLAEAHLDAAALDGLEALDFSAQRVRARSQERNCVTAFRVCYRALDALGARYGHGDARKRQALRIDDTARNGASSLLSEECRCRTEECGRCTCERFHAEFHP